MKKKPSSSSSSSTRNVVVIFGSKLMICLSTILCIYSLLKLSSQYSSTHQRSLSLVDEHFQGSPKIAFLFLARTTLYLDFLWGSFFENGDARNFSIYVHSKPGFVFDERNTKSAFFYGRQLPKSIQVLWGEATMIEAERLLLGEALKDPANQRFVLLSDSCVPLYNFSYIYNSLISSPKSFVDSFRDAKERSYNPKMSPIIRKGRWRKGSQWFTLIRKHAKVVVNDEVILPVFKRYCKRRFSIDPTTGKQRLNLHIRYNCIPDEHYVQTLLATSNLEGELERRTLTYTLWINQPTRRAWHPFTFDYPNVGHQQIKQIQDINHVYYESEYRTEWCRNNSTFVNCFLFARKFSRGAAMRMLSEGILANNNATDSTPS